MTTYNPGSSLPDDAKKKWIQREANKLLLETFEHIHTVVPGVFCICRSQEDQNDKGVDFEIEAEAHGETIQLFKIQNKGQERRFEPLKTTAKKGFISFQIEIKHVRYYRHELNAPLIFTVCDLEEKKVYWHPIQMDDELDRRIKTATTQDSIQLFIDPNKFISTETILEVFQDVALSAKAQHRRFYRLAKHPLVKLSDDFEIDRSKHILDQMVDYLDWTHKHLSYYPIGLLTNRYPFKLSDSYQPDYRLFNLYTDNDQIIAMLNAVKVKKHKIVNVVDESFFAGVEDYEAKLYKIFIVLSYNLIWGICDKNGQQLNHFHLYEETDDRNNPISSYEKLDFLNAMKGLEVTPTSLKEWWSRAFLHYRFGNYLKAVADFKEIGNQTKNGRDTIGNYIANFNLQRLGVLIQDSHWEEYADAQLLEEIKSIDPEDIYHAYHNEDGPDVFSYVNSNEFNDQPRQEIGRLLKHLQQTFYLSQKGGWGSNAYSRELINEFADYLSFITNNFIIQEFYFQFHQILDDFIEGLFASYGQSKNQGGRLEAMDDYHLYVLFLYASNETLVKYANRYGINELIYKESPESPNERFFKSISTFFAQGSELRSVYDQTCEKGNRKFLEHYNQIYSTVVTLLALIKRDDDEVNTIAGQILTFLKTENILFPRFAENTYLFLIKKRDQLSEQNLIEFHNLVLDQGRFHFSKLKDAVINCLVHRKVKLSPDEVEFRRLKKFLIDKCTDCGNVHRLSNLKDYYFILNDPQQQKWIVDTILAQLRKQFTPELYYFSSIYNVIPYDPVLFDLFLARSIPPADLMASIPHDSRNFNHLEEVFNLAFKFELPLSSKQFDPFRNLNNYYDWLLDIEGFDYDNFDVEWLLQYPTTIFLDEFRKHSRIKDILEDTLNRQSNARLENLYFKLYSSPKRNPS